MSMPFTPCLTTDLDKEFYCKYPTLSKIELVFSPSHWGHAIRHYQNAYTCRCICIGQLDIIYGPESSVTWVATQLTGLFLLSSSKDTGVVDCIRSFSKIFAQEIRQYKLSEMLLFFARFSVGHYGANNWSAYDLRRIGTAFFTEFLPERRQEIDFIEREKQHKQREQEWEERRKMAVSYEEYLKRKEQRECSNVQIVKTEK